MKLEFNYPMNVTISGIYNPALEPLNMQVAFTWLEQRISRSTSSVSLPGNKFSGTFVIQDSRVNYAINPYPSGLRIGGILDCDSSGNVSIIEERGWVSYIIYQHGLDWPKIKLDPSTVLLMATSSLQVMLVFKNADCRQDLTGNIVSENCIALFWFSTAPGIIPNATEVQGLYFALCVHTAFYYHPIDSESEGQEINPSQLVVRMTSSLVVPVAYSLLYLIPFNLMEPAVIQNVTAAQGIPIFCDGGVLIPFQEMLHRCYWLLWSQ